VRASRCFDDIQALLIGNFSIYFHIVHYYFQGKDMERHETKDDICDWACFTGGYVGL